MCTTPEQQAVAEALVKEAGPPSSYRDRNLRQVDLAYQLVGLADMDDIEALQLIATVYRAVYGEAQYLPHPH